jgi:MFS family permease
LFGLLGLVFAAWAARIPAVRDGLHLSAGQLGLALLCAGVGGLASFPLAATMVARYGQARAALGGGTALLVALAFIGCSANLPSLMASLALLGAAASCFDVAINAIGAIAEKKAGRSIMSMLHAWFCVGTVSGALSGSVIAGQGVTPQIHFLVLAATMALPLWLACRVLQTVAAEADADPVCSTRQAVAGTAAQPGHATAPDPNPEPNGQPARSRTDSRIYNAIGRRIRNRIRSPFRLLPRPLLILGMIGFFGAIAENGIADWSGLFMRDSMGAAVGIAPLGYAGFTGAMLIMRLVADRLKDRFGARRVVAIGALVAVVGITVAVSAQLLAAAIAGAQDALTLPLAIAGFALAGAGLAGVFPFVFSAAGSAGPTALAGVATISYFGALVGPPVIGFLAQLAGLQAALGSLAVLCLALAAVAWRARALV